MAGTAPTPEPVAGSEGRLVRTVEHLPDGRRLTLYASTTHPKSTARPPDEGGRGAPGVPDGDGRR